MGTATGQKLRLHFSILIFIFHLYFNPCVLTYSCYLYFIGLWSAHSSRGAIIFMLLFHICISRFSFFSTNPPTPSLKVHCKWDDRMYAYMGLFLFLNYYY